MSLRDDDTCLRDMLDAAREAMHTSSGRVRGDLNTDRAFSAALERFIEIIGEAANHVSQARQDRLPGVPWKAVIAMRNRLVHGYADVDKAILWKIVHDDLPTLIAELERALT